MSEKTKLHMSKQVNQLVEALSKFNIPVFQDDLNEDEYPSDSNYILIVFGDMEKRNKTLSQEFFVTYISKDNPFVDEMSVEIISTLDLLKSINFKRTIKQRLQEKETDNRLDQVIIVCERLLPYECKI